MTQTADSAASHALTQTVRPRPSVRPSVRVMVSVFERRTYGGAAAQGEKKMRQLATAKCALASAHGVARKERSYLNPDM